MADVCIVPSVSLLCSLPTKKAVSLGCARPKPFSASEHVSAGPGPQSRAGWRHPAGLAPRSSRSQSFGLRIPFDLLQMMEAPQELLFVLAILLITTVSEIETEKMLQHLNTPAQIPSDVSEK